MIKARSEMALPFYFTTQITAEMSDRVKVSSGYVDQEYKDKKLTSWQDICT
jgi:hypothetical protein